MIREAYNPISTLSSRDLCIHLGLKVVSNDSLITRIIAVFSRVKDSITNWSGVEWFIKHRPDVLVCKSIEATDSFMNAIEHIHLEQIVDQSKDILKEIEINLKNKALFKQMSAGVAFLPALLGLLSLITVEEGVRKFVTEKEWDEKLGALLTAMDGTGSVCSQIVTLASIAEKIQTTFAITEWMNVAERMQVLNTIQNSFQWVQFVGAVGIGLSTAAIVLEAKKWWEMNDFYHDYFSNPKQMILEDKPNVSFDDSLSKLLETKDQDLEKYFMICDGKKLKERIRDAFRAAESHPDSEAATNGLKAKAVSLKARVNTVKGYQPWVILAGVISIIASVLFLLSFATPVGYALVGIAALITIAVFIHQRVSTYHFENEWGLRKPRFRKYLPDFIVQKVFKLSVENNRLLV